MRKKRLTHWDLGASLSNVNLLTIDNSFFLWNRQDKSNNNNNKQSNKLPILKQSKGPFCLKAERVKTYLLMILKN